MVKLSNICIAEGNGNNATPINTALTFMKENKTTAAAAETAAAATEQTQAAIVPQTNSEKLAAAIIEKAELRAAFKQANPGPEEDAAFAKVQAISAEVDRLQKIVDSENLQAKLAEERSAAIEAIKERLENYRRATDILAEEGHQEDVVATSKEIVDSLVNDLLKVKGVPVASKVATSNSVPRGTGTREAGIGAEIYAEIERLFATGLDIATVTKQLKETGKYTVGTLTTQVTLFKRAKGMLAPKA